MNPDRLDTLLPYIPIDRRYSLAFGEPLAERSSGAALFVDMSGFTLLTELLVRELGPHRGAEELTRVLDQIYDAVIREIHSYRGSIIAFAGDAVTAWFDGDDGLCATTAARAVQEAIRPFRHLATPTGHVVSLSVKASVASGEVGRYVVGDPEIRLLDAVVGNTMARLAVAEKLARSNDIVLDPATVTALGQRAQVLPLPIGHDGIAYARLITLQTSAEPNPWPELPAHLFDAATIRTWVLRPLLPGLIRDGGDMLAELRPTVALFVRFDGIDYDFDPNAGRQLDAYIRWVQNVVARYDGTLIDLNIGDKGSYLYVNFGAPVAHENDVDRACAAALALLAAPDDLACSLTFQLGISQGRMRAGAYGARTHRTYGVLGDEVNMAARLMMAAPPGQILVSERARVSAGDGFTWEELPPLKVKGRDQPITPYVLLGQQRERGVDLHARPNAGPLLGRNAELTIINTALDDAVQSAGQILALAGDAGVGKSRLSRESVRLAEALGYASFGGKCESHGANTSYLVWRPILRMILGIEADMTDAAAIARIQARLTQIGPRLVRRLPLLGPALNISIPESSFTRSLDAKLRKTSLEALLVELFVNVARQHPLLLVLEDCHWMDELSRDLLEQLARTIANHPVAMLLLFRHDNQHRWGGERLTMLPHYHQIDLLPLGEQSLYELATYRLQQYTARDNRDGIPDAVVRRLVEQAEGNPLYLEELINYIYAREIPLLRLGDETPFELPSSLQNLVLSRVDQLRDVDKLTLKVASVWGRSFQADWLASFFPELGEPKTVQTRLDTLCLQELTVRDEAAAEPTYLFRHGLFQSAIYESLPYSTRMTLHEQAGSFIETRYHDRLESHIRLLAHHFANTTNVERQRLYLRWAGEQAQAEYANDGAIHYYRAVLPLLSGKPRVEVLLELGEVLQLVGQWDEAGTLYQQARVQAASLDEQKLLAWCHVAEAELWRLRGRFAEARRHQAEAMDLFTAVGDDGGVAQVLHIGGTTAAQSGDYDAATAAYDRSLEIRRRLGDREGEARLLSNLAIVAEYQGDLEASLALHESALQIRRELGGLLLIGNSLNNVGHILLVLQRSEEAERRLQEAVDIQREIGDFWALANGLNNLGNVYREQGAYAKARNCYRESLKLHLTLQDLWSLCYLFEDIAHLAVLAQDDSAAVSLYVVAQKLRATIDSPLPPAELQSRDALQLESATRLGKARADQATRVGASLSPDDAVDFALEALN